MSLLMNDTDRVAAAQWMEGPPFSFPWAGFQEFFRARVEHPGLRNRIFLTYIDDDRNRVRTYTYAEFGAAVRTLSGFLEEQCGLMRGDRLATILFNHDQTVILYFAAWYLGVAVVPINMGETIERKRYILEHSEAAVAFGWQDAVDEIQSLKTDLPGLRLVVPINDEGPCPIRALAGSEAGRGSTHFTPTLGDEALIVYTSGTTGPPKGVMLTAFNLLIDADAIADWHGFGPDDRLMCVLPIHHVNGTVVTLLTPFYSRGSTVLTRKFKTAAFWRRLETEGISCVSVVPTLLEYLLEADDDLSLFRLERFRGFICGAGPLLKETAVRFEDRFPFRICHGYGLSETTCYSCFLPNELNDRRHRHWLTAYEFPSIGVPVRHNDMAILDEGGRPVPERARGEICIRGRTVCAGYFKRPDANAQAFQWGWFRSGDQGFLIRDQGGRPFFFISGRLKELIIRGGINISPLEIDDLLKTHPKVKFAMAVPFENRFYGEEIAAYVVPCDETHPPSEADLLTFCRARLPFSKQPKVILLGREVPYTSTGKPKRLELKTQLAEQLAVYKDRQFRDHHPQPSVKL
jgi:long-chain acyl-CoA synthetase